MASEYQVQLIDAHTHTQPTPAATKALSARYGFSSTRDGTVAELFESMDRAGVTRTLIVPWIPAQDMVSERIAAGTDRDMATAEVVDQWRELNRWAAEAVTQNPERLSCLVGLDPVIMDEDLIEAEVSERLASGASGLKVAPKFIRRRPDDEIMEVVWRTARDNGVFVLSECGAHGFANEEVWGHPSYFEDVLRSFPGVTVQLAHLGLGAEDDMARLTARYPNVVTDTSLRLGLDASEETADLIRRIGTDRVLFGTNYPLVDQVEYAQMLRTLPLTEDELHQIGHENAVRILRC